MDIELAQALKEIADLKAQIEKMKRCFNCKYHNKFVESKCGECEDYSKWEIKRKMNIKELEKRCNELFFQVNEKTERIAELEKENAELKDDNKVMADNYSKMEQKFYDNLTKAKVFIRSLKSLIEDVCDINYLSKDNTRLLVEAEQFLSEVEK